MSFGRVILLRPRPQLESNSISTPLTFRQDWPRRTAAQRLKSDVLRRLVVAVEALRARAVADRRRRVVDTFCRRVDAFVRRTGVSALQVVIHPAGHLVVRRGQRPDVRVYPIIGHPDTTHAHEISDACSVLQEKGFLVFDANGIDEATAAHLRWLNEYLPISSFSTTEVEEWLPRL